MNSLAPSGVDLNNNGVSTSMKSCSWRRKSRDAAMMVSRRRMYEWFVLFRKSRYRYLALVAAFTPSAWAGWKGRVNLTAFNGWIWDTSNSYSPRPSRRWACGRRRTIPVTDTGVSEVISEGRGCEEVNWRMLPWESRRWKNWRSLPNFLLGRRSQPWRVCDLSTSSRVIQLFFLVAVGIWTENQVSKME